MGKAVAARHDRGVAHYRFALLATIFALLMCCAGAAQAVAATASPGSVAIAFKSETFPLER